MTGRNSRYYSSLLQGGSRPLISLECGDRAGCHGELIVATAPDFFRREGFLYVGRYAGTFQHLLSPGPVLNDRQGDSIPIPKLERIRSSEPTRGFHTDQRRQSVL